MLFLRLTIFVFFVAAVVHIFRSYVPADRRMFVSAGWAIGTALIGVLAILVGSGAPQDAGAVGMLTFNLFGMLPLAGALWVTVYAGQLLGDRQGGYWIKQGTRTQDAIIWGAAAVIGLLALNYAVCHFVTLPLNPVPTGRAAISQMFGSLAYSLGEEFFYRGCVQALLVSWFARFRGGQWAAVLLAAVVFMAQHMVGFTQQISMILPAGIGFGFLFARFGLWTAASVHFAANMMIFVLPHLG